MHGHTNIKKDTSVFVFRAKQFCLIRPTAPEHEGITNQYLSVNTA